MISILNKKIPTKNSPPVYIHIYYLMLSVTFCYLYFHKFVANADFHGVLSSGGIYAVLNFEAVKPLQYRILIPLIFKLISLFHLIPDKPAFFLLIIILTHFILLSFYFLLNRYFVSKEHNWWLAPVILYPMFWNFIILNGQFFYMDFSILLIIIIGIYSIVTQKNNLLILIFFLGVLNHPSAGYLGISFLLYNYRTLFRLKTILYSAALGVIYIGVLSVMDLIFPDTGGYFVLYNLERNLSLFHTLPVYMLVRDAIFNFGGLYFFVFILFFSAVWKKFRSPLLYINLTIIPYVVSVWISFSIEEMRNYIAIIPFIVLVFLIYLSSIKNSYLKPLDAIKSDLNE
jgi:hypothetical protein